MIADRREPLVRSCREHRQRHQRAAKRERPGRAPVSTAKAGSDVRRGRARPLCLPSRTGPGRGPIGSAFCQSSAPPPRRTARSMLSSAAKYTCRSSTAARRGAARRRHVVARCGPRRRERVEDLVPRARRRRGRQSRTALPATTEIRSSSARDPFCRFSATTSAVDQRDDQEIAVERRAKLDRTERLAPQTTPSAARMRDQVAGRRPRSPSRRAPAAAAVIGRPPTDAPRDRSRRPPSSAWIASPAAT